MNIYISNLRSGIDDNELTELFAPFGEVKSAEIVKDVFNGQSRGFGYVEMVDEIAAKKAIEALNQTKVQELTVTVEEAQPKIERKGSYKVGDGRVKEYRFRKN